VAEEIGLELPRLPGRQRHRQICLRPIWHLSFPSFQATFWARDASLAPCT
jgi:hypothetical protein